MVGIVIVSHSAELAEGVVELARQMGGEELALEPAGGLEDGSIGTDVELVRAAIECAMSDDGVLVLMDLGSALMSAEMAVELLGTNGRVELSEAPLVEGAVAAAAAARGGATLDEVAAEARGALQMKVAQLGGDAAAVASPAGGAVESPAGGAVESPRDGAAAPGGAESQAGAQASIPVLNEIGLHARPAAAVVELASRYDANLRLSKLGGPGPVGARSLTGLMTLVARKGDELLATASGPQAQEALDALQQLAAEGFGEGVASKTAAGTSSAARPAPPGERALAPPAERAQVPPGERVQAPPGERAHAPPAERRQAPPAERPQAPRGARPQAAAVPAAPEPGTELHGIAASAGIALGPVRHLNQELEPLPERAAGDSDQERQRLEAARAAARSAIKRDHDEVAARGAAAQAAIFTAHLALLDDDALLARARSAIDAGASAEAAWHEATEQTAAQWRTFDDELLRARATDVVDTGRRVLAALAGGEARAHVAGDGVLVTGELTPGEAAALDPELVRGIATAHGTATAHAAILARALGLPAVVGLGDPVLAIGEGTPVMLDGDQGTVLVAPSEDAAATARRRGERLMARRRAARERAAEPAVTRDGTHVEVSANLGGAGGAAEAVALGADGVGLLRTEFLFLDRAEIPTEDEQVEVLGQIAGALDGRPMIVRTLDVGADKPLTAVPMPDERNPFLGRRGLRLSLQEPELFGAQLRAILRVAAEHPLKVMFPMVATPDELDAAVAAVAQARAETDVDAPLEVGIMVEVPSAALMSERLARRADFFSIGTNDLTQYTMAAERGNELVGELLAGTQPAVLSLVQATVAGARAHGRWVGVCGELAGDPAAALLLVGLGVRELSMAPGLVAEVKEALRSATLADAEGAAQRALGARDAVDARAAGAELL